jgi:gliding motility-associated-like protein
VLLTSRNIIKTDYQILLKSFSLLLILAKQDDELKMKNLYLILIISISFNLYAQTTILTLRPNALNGKDALIDNRTPVTNTNFGNDVDLASWAWTLGGAPTIARSLIQFDLSLVPSNATINSVKLSLFCNTTSSVTQLQAGANASYLKRITSSWNENTVTWSNQPTTTNSNQITLAESTSQKQDYLNTDVTNLVIDMINNPSNSFGFMLQLQTESTYRTMLFSSSDHPDSTKWPMLVITYTIDTCLTFKHVAAFTVSDTIGTAPLAVQFTNNSLSTATSFIWNFGDGTATSTIKNPAHTFLKAGNHKTKLFAYNLKGCVDSAEKIISVIDSCADFIHGASFTASALSGVAPLAVQFTNNSFPTATSFIWNFGDSTSTLKNPTHTFYTAGKNKVKLIAFNSKGCIDSFETIIDVIDSCADIKNVAAFSTNISNGPEPLTVQFKATTAASAKTFLWNFGDGTATSSLQNPTHVFLKKGVYHTKLIVFNSRGCADSLETIITVLDSCALFKNVTSFTANPTIGYVPLDVQFTNNSSLSAVSFVWNFGDTTPTSTLQNPTHRFLKDGLYIVKLLAYNQRGCVDSFETTIRIVNPINLIIPNVFTPNNDVVNDVFEVSYTPFSLQYLKGSIWNRWGSMVNEFEMPNGKWWDGLINGVDASEGIYFYIIETNDLLNNKKNYHGTVTLLR